MTNGKTASRQSASSFVTTTTKRYTCLSFISDADGLLLKVYDATFLLSLFHLLWNRVEMWTIKWCRYLCWALLIVLPYVSMVRASANLYYNHWHLHSPARESQAQLSRSRRARLLSKSSTLSPMYPSPSALLVARKEKPKKKKEAAELQVSQEEEQPEYSFDDLGPVGKVVASATELGIAIALNYAQGYLTGWFAGTVIGIPGFLFRPVEPGVPQLFLTEVKGRLGRMNTRSVRFGKQFGGISAIFKGSDVFVRRLRYGKNDEWNDILGSAIAGAIFARNGTSNPC